MLDFDDIHLGLIVELAFWDWAGRINHDGMVGVTIFLLDTSNSHLCDGSSCVGFPGGEG